MLVSKQLKGGSIDLNRLFCRMPTIKDRKVKKKKKKKRKENIASLLNSTIGSAVPNSDLDSQGCRQLTLLYWFDTQPPFPLQARAEKTIEFDSKVTTTIKQIFSTKSNLRKNTKACNVNGCALKTRRLYFTNVFNIPFHYYVPFYLTCQLWRSN